MLADKAGLPDPVLLSSAGPDSNGLYLHIPFCIRKCEYCDFYSITRFDQVDAFVDALLQELHLRVPEGEGRCFDTIFFGGGTPSLLSPVQMERIWQSLQLHYRILPDAQVTIEANPGDLGYEKLAFLRQLGFNRLSMGVQSFVAEELKFLGRIHSVEDVETNVGYARRAGFDNLNIDLMTSFPGISRESFRYSLQRALSFNTEHLSCYTLIFEPGTILYNRMKMGEVTPLNDDLEAGYYLMAQEELEAAGYLQYEISNFARDSERVCKHNLLYWQHQPYLGFGPSAHSFDGSRRFANKRSVMAYIKDLSRGELPQDFQEQLSRDQLMFETVFLGLRLREGIDLARFARRFQIDLRERYAGALQKLEQSGLVEWTPRRLRLSKSGWLMADSIASCFD